MLSLITYLIIIYTPPVKGNIPISSRFGDFRVNSRATRWHFHHAVDIGKRHGIKVYYPENEDTIYHPEIVLIDTFSEYNAYWGGQTNYFIVGRFCFTHLALRDKNHNPPSTLLNELGIPRKPNIRKKNIRKRIKSWIDLWKYCKENDITWRGGLQIGVIGKPRSRRAHDHLHFGELLISNQGREGNIWINPLWRDLITVNIRGVGYPRYGYLQGVTDYYTPVIEMITNLHGTLRGYRIMEKNSSRGIWDFALWAGENSLYDSKHRLYPIHNTHVEKLSSWYFDVKYI